MQDNDENKETTENKNEYPEPFTMEYYQRIWELARDERAKQRERQEQWDREHGIRRRSKEEEDLEKRLQSLADDTNAMDNAPATILYIFVMIFGSIFYDRLYIWIIATIIWLRHIFRMEIKRKKIIDEYNKNKSEKEKYR